MLSASDAMLAPAQHHLKCDTVHAQCQHTNSTRMQPAWLCSSCCIADAEKQGSSRLRCLPARQPVQEQGLTTEVLADAMHAEQEACHRLPCGCIVHRLSLGVYLRGFGFVGRCLVASAQRRSQILAGAQCPALRSGPLVVYICSHT